MGFMMHAVCGCHNGKIRRCNQDNFLFFGQHLEEEHNGLETPLTKNGVWLPGTMLAVFDGMGGENYGETASFTAAATLAQSRRSLKQLLIPAEEYLHEIVQVLNLAVTEAQQRLVTDRMGTTAVGLYVGMRCAYIWNVGDSRGYLFRNGVLRQLTVDHVESCPRPGSRKGYLNQYLGMDPEEILVEPDIARTELYKGDRYLLCSDGLTDMLQDEELRRVLAEETDAANCVQRLIRMAMECGGRDNITLILCEVR